MTKIVTSHWKKGFLRILLMSVPAVVAGCSDEGVINSPVAAPLPVQRINRIVVDERTVTMEVTCSTPDPCHAYLWTEETIQGTDYYFRIFGRSTGQGPCPCVVGSIEVPVSITTPRRPLWSSFLDLQWDKRGYEHCRFPYLLIINTLRMKKTEKKYSSGRCCMVGRSCF